MSISNNSKMIVTLIVSSAIVIGSLFFIELTCRISVYFYSGNSLSFLYGFRSSMIYEKREFTFYKMGKKPKLSGNRVIATFGGSTTYGYNYSKNASSWPYELGKILQNVEIRNFGKNGTNSNYAVEKLPIANHDGRIDIVMWANYVNESDILYKTDTKKYFLLRLDMTIQKYSLAYWTMHKMVQYIKDNIGIVKNKPDKKIHPEKFALDNYKMNFVTAYDYCKKNKIKLIIVRLPSCPIDSPPNKFISKLEDLMTELSAEYNVPLIDVNKHYRQNNIFCVGNHQDLKGHQQTARYIKEHLESIKF